MAHITRGWWRRWKQHHFPGMTTPEAVEFISNGHWMVITGDNPEPFTIRRKARSGSESEADALKEMLEMIELREKKLTEIFNPFAKNFTKVLVKTNKKKGNQLFKALRGNKKSATLSGSTGRRNICKECGFILLQTGLTACPQCRIEF